MTAPPDLHYLCAPRYERPVDLPVEFITVQEFLVDEPACKLLWELISTQFKTRGKFLTIWPSVRFVAVCRDSDGCAAGFLLVTAPVNWQIDYVVVRPNARGKGVATALVNAALNEALLRKAPYVMLTSHENLRSLYEGCGFTVVNVPELVA
jgi:GNAT superfamily N-acetyltransferase